MKLNNNPFTSYLLPNYEFIKCENSEKQVGSDLNDKLLGQLSSIQTWIHIISLTLASHQDDSHSPG